MNTEIKQTHLAVMREIVAFIQDRGWDVQSLEISRHEKGTGFAEPQQEEWQEKKYHWFLNIRTGPKDEEDELPKQTLVPK